MEPRIPSVSVVYDRGAFLYGVRAGKLGCVPQNEVTPIHGHINEEYVAEKATPARLRSHKRRISARKSHPSKITVI